MHAQILSSSVPEYRGPFAFFRRHLNGDYSLARSYWINSALLPALFTGVATALIAGLDGNYPARYVSMVVVLVTFFGLIVWLWSVAGTWASASKHVQRGGASGWAIAVKILIVCGAVKVFSETVTSAPALRTHLSVAGGAQLAPRTTLQLRADGRSILLSGGINEGSAEQLDKALQAAPGVATVVLSSQGGWLREGQLLADVIRKRGLNTYVEGTCASACTIAFLAGKDRAAAPGARLGFHASHSIGNVVATGTPSETAQLRKIYLDAGLPDSFVRRAMDTPPDQMWYPSHAILQSATALTRRSLGGETAALSTSVRSKEDLAAEFKKSDMFAAMAERAPEAFDNLLEAAWEKARHGATDAEIIVAARAKITAALPKYLTSASNETLMAYHELMYDELKALRERDVSACVEMAFPSGQPMKVIANLPPELAKREFVLITAILREADVTRTIHPSPQAIAQVAQRAAKYMTPQQILVFRDAVARRQAPPAQTCGAALAFYVGLQSIPLSERAHAVRVLFSAS